MAATGMPETIGNFRIVSKLGQGGMGAVFRAVHGTLERPVALKILPPEFASNPEYVMRFLREARTVATLRHENVVQVYDAGEQGGQYYIAMELVDGCNLLKYAEDKQKVSEEEGLNLLLQAAKGLAAAHAKGLVHRDVKPENLLLGSDSILRVVDFGLVMESTSTTQLTATGACLGTPMYMSPEQADGEVADVRTDVYSLGVTFFRVFTGQAPFSSPTVMNLLFKHKFEAPPSPKSLRPDLSENVSNLLLHMMAKRREDRPQTAAKLVEMIESLKQGKPIPPPPTYVAPLPGNISGAAMVSGPALTSSSKSAGSMEATLLSGARPAPASGGSNKVIAVVAAVVVLLVALGIYFATRPKDQASGASGSDLPPVPVSKTDYLARGDDRFAAARYTEALEIYREGLIATPDNAELKARIEKTEKALRVVALLRAGEEAEQKGELEEASAKFKEASALDEPSAREALARVKQKQDQNRNLGDEQRLQQREQCAKKAADEEKAKRYAQAAELYSKAASLSEGTTRTAFAEKAAECRRQDYITKAIDAEKAGDLPAAKNFYERALAVKQDDLLQKSYETVVKKMRDADTAADTERAFSQAMKEGDAALQKGDLATAKFQFGIAIGLRPQSQEAQNKVTETNARDLIAKGDASRGDPNTAIKYYNEAGRIWPPLDGIAQARIKALQPTNPGSAALKNVDALVRAEQDDKALTELTNALRADPTNGELRRAKAALESMQACGTIYSELDKICDAAHSRAEEGYNIEDEKDLRDEFKTFDKEFAERARKVRPLFLNHDYDQIKLSLETARKDAGRLHSELSDAEDYYDSRAAKVSEKAGVDVPVFGRVGIKGDTKKADKLRRVAEGFKKLGTQAKALRE
ncbi:MAG TPA: protein kinase [Planctomycetota bacterium]|nr:protein kinase [Planctomycetota bacterium]